MFIHSKEVFVSVFRVYVSARWLYVLKIWTNRLYYFEGDVAAVETFLYIGYMETGKKKRKKILLSGLAFFVILFSSMRFTAILEDFSARVSGYYYETIGGILFLHTDKSIYIPNESIWFKAYILDSEPLQHEVLYVRLLNEQKQIVLQKEFQIYDIRSHGDMLLPITLAPGRYRLIAYTDKMISFNPENVFVQPIQVIKDRSTELTAEALNLRLPKTTATVMVHCYPEGGHLVNGTSNRVLIAVTDAGGQPVVAKVALKSLARQIVATTTNIDGLTRLTFTPDVREKYSLAINSTGYSRTIAFPVTIDPRGYVLQLTGPPDHPVIMVKNQNMQENVVLLGRTLSELKFNKPLTLKSGDSVLVALPQNDSVNHVIDLGLFDADNKLLAERLVYLPVPEKYHVTFHFDKAGYTSREKVRADIMVTDVNGNRVSANLSVAVVAKQTLDPSVEKRITETDLNALQHYPINLKGINDINNELIREDIRVGNWAAVMNYQPKGQINMISNAAGVYGYVVNKKNKKIDLKTLYLYGKSGVTQIPVKANGSFSIPAKDLITERAETKYLIVNKDFNDRYDLHLTNYSADFDAKLVMISLPESPSVYDLVKHSDQLSSIMSGKILQEVIIKGKRSTSATPEDFNVKEYHSSNCSDYVCFYNILNCKNHPGGGEPPTEGQIYVLNGRPVRYHGCASNDDSKKNSYILKKIDSPQSFFLPDYAREPISAPELQSTIFWDPNLNTQAGGKSTIEFYTSDIKGAFTIVVQGLTATGLIPIFGKSEFRVIHPEESSNK
jgi:hypothetical protein